MTTSFQEQARVVQLALSSGVIDPSEDTAVLLVDWDVLDHRLGLLSAHWPGVFHAIAIKSQPHKAVLTHMVKKGFCLEAASIEEVRLALSVGCAPSRIVFDSPVKTKAELAWMHQQAPAALVNANSLEELPRHGFSPSYKLGLRVNPEVHTGAPELFHVSASSSKFGVSIRQKEAILDAIVRYPITGLHMHSGSQITRLDAQLEAIEMLISLTKTANQRLAAAGESRRIEWLDIGGGLPSSPWETMVSYAKSAMDLLRPLLEDVSLYTEFGQWVHTDAGWALSAVEYVLPREGDTPDVAYVHLGADYFMRDAYTQPRPFPMQPLSSDGTLKKAHERAYAIAGPLCFGGDYIHRNKSLPLMEEGDWLCIGQTGANTLGLWSRHCSRMLPKVVGYSSQKNTLEVLSPRVSMVL